MKKKLKNIHIGAVSMLVVYFVLANSVLAHFTLGGNQFLAFFGPWVYGSTSAVIFLYIFSHEDFFKFARDIEKRQQKKEKLWLKRFKHFGGMTTTLLITIVGGPILGALTTRILLSSLRFRYLFLILANIPSTLFTMGLIKGTISLFS